MEEEQNKQLLENNDDNNFSNEKMLYGETILPEQLSTAEQVHEWIMNLND